LLLPALAIAGGTYLGAQANANAANTAAQATLRGAQIQADTANQIAANDQQIAAPAQSYLRGVMATSDTLTPAQTKQLEQNRLSITNQLHSSPFAGSGRSAAALFKSADTDFINSALDANKNKAIAAANTLAGRASSADTAALEAGKTLGTAATTAGGYDANAGLATGKLYGQAFGDVASLINRQSKGDVTLDIPTTRLRLMP
jgi:hypothetical protein